MKSLQILVPGITCESCRKNILTALQYTKGVFHPEVELSSKIVSFDYDQRICNVNKIEMNLKRRYGEIHPLSNE
ncbi:MAG TPA: copper chaperone [Spirochaetes bacterium]|nr:copper chaperone [Spirochaetota bacterium]